MGIMYGLPNDDLLGAVDVVPLDLTDVRQDLLPDLQVADLRLALSRTTLL